MLDERVVDELINLLNRVSREARISIERTDEWERCNRRIEGIGKTLFDKGGEPLMQVVYQRVYEKGHLTGRYLDRQWNGIGRWMG